jgi:hypothetical protein
MKVIERLAADEIQLYSTLHLNIATWDYSLQFEIYATRGMLPIAPPIFRAPVQDQLLAVE